MMWRAWIMWSAAMALMFGLQGCASSQGPEPIVRVVEKAVPFPTPCVSDATPPPPNYAATWDDLKAMTPGRRYAMAVAGFKERDQRLSELEPLIAACRK